MEIASGTASVSSFATISLSLILSACAPTTAPVSPGGGSGIAGGGGTAGGSVGMAGGGGTAGSGGSDLSVGNGGGADMAGDGGAGGGGGGDMAGGPDMALPSTPTTGIISVSNGDVRLDYDADAGAAALLLRQRSQSDRLLCRCAAGQLCH